jgi:hypothetical protein
MKTSSKHLIHWLLCSIFLFSSVSIFAQEEEKKDEAKKSDSKNTEYFRGGMKIENVGDDSVIIHIKKRDFSHFSKGGCPMMHKKGKYNGHWAGVDLGWNGYVNKDFNMTFPSGEQYLNLKAARSMMVNLNPIEFNLNLIRNHFGLTSGLGFSLNNYYFSGSYMLIPDSLALTAVKIINQNNGDAAMKVNKLFVGWITLPVFFEFQTNPEIHANSFHVSVGVIGGFRIQSYTKQEFRNDDHMTYYLQDLSGRPYGSLYVDERRIRKHSEYHLNPFKLDGSFRIGWSFLNLWSTYSFTTLFQKDQGPELYPWSVGVTLAGW